MNSELFFDDPVAARLGISVPGTFPYLAGDDLLHLIGNVHGAFVLVQFCLIGNFRNGETGSGGSVGSQYAVGEIFFHGSHHNVLNPGDATSIDITGQGATLDR